MKSHFFEGLDGTERPPKPRSVGLTMVVDWGLGFHAQEDLLQIASEHADFAKIAVGISRLLPNEVLIRKMKTYQEYGVEPFPGGQYLEYAEMEGKVDAYLPAVVEAGYRWVEVSDNVAPVSLAWKERLIRSAVEDFGLKVLGEVGKKEGIESDRSLTDDARACLDAGAEIVLLEAAEIVGDDEETARLIEEIVEAIGVEMAMFELPGPWIEGVGPSDVHQMRVQLIGRYGPEVNLGNVSPTDLVSLEAYRRGLGVNAGKQD